MQGTSGGEDLRSSWSSGVVQAARGSTSGSLVDSQELGTLFPAFSLEHPYTSSTSDTSYKQIHLRFGNKYYARWVYYAEVERMTTLVLVTSDHPTKGAHGDQQERRRLDSIRDRMRAVVRNYVTYLITKEHTHLPILSYVSIIS